MDYQFIRAFYYGNLTPNDRNMPNDSDLGKACSAFCEAEAALTAALQEAPEKDTLATLLRTHGEIVGISARDGFCNGFRLGALAMLDILLGAE